MQNNKNWLEGIEQLDNEKEYASNENDLSWLAAEKETPSFLEGIELLETANSRLLKHFIEKGILEILKKKAANKPLNQPEMNILNEFRQIFPDTTIDELEKEGK
ncbi:hypothetical protein M3205_03640 [Cytobacillus firmus]|uniref:hypothetical protein n=1 Tax=Cytobacillus firmus TaxID=1399 RepID=UPI00204227A2|nr:hypothetical protein [Cytobacillus firmus]MCM3704810.1 hypothetical protein [Cytobacillus firmus]